MGGISVTAERHSHTGPTFGFYLDVLMLKSRLPKWTLILVSDFWETGGTEILHSTT
ncbi:MAG TPA: hypothetical protein VG966_12580 [Hyphomicrobiaceae bacterium]|nr:hypothetical protein [Hyphomicrobiaceae bacterium]